MVTLKTIWLIGLFFLLFQVTADHCVDSFSIGSQKPLKVFSVKKNQQKSVFIRVSQQDKDVSESSPNSLPQEEVKSFIVERATWKLSAWITVYPAK